MPMEVIPVRVFVLYDEYSNEKSGKLNWDISLLKMIRVTWLVRRSNKHTFLACKVSRKKSC